VLCDAAFHLIIKRQRCRHKRPGTVQMLSLLLCPKAFAALYAAGDECE
jgi:hypothetical protein